MGRNTTKAQSEANGDQYGLFGDPPEQPASQPAQIERAATAPKSEPEQVPNHRRISPPPQDSSPSDTSSHPNDREDEAPNSGSNSGNKSSHAEGPEDGADTSSAPRRKRITKRGDLRPREHFEYSVFSEPLLHTWMRLGDLEVAPVLKDLTFSKSIYMPDEACGELDATIVLTLLELSPVCVYEWHRPGEWVVIANLMQFGLARETLPPDTEVTVAVPPSKRMAKQLLRYETEHATLLQQVLLSKNTDRAIEQSRLLRRANGKPFSLRLREENLAITRRRISSRDDAQEV